MTHSTSSQPGPTTAPQRASARTALLDDPQIRPFLPLLWVAWSDGDLDAAQLDALRARIGSTPWLRPAARLALAAWLDPSDPPSASELRAVLQTIESVAGTLSPEQRRDLVALGASMAPEGVDQGALASALAELEERLDGPEDAPLPVVGKGERKVDAAATFDVPALAAVLDGVYAAPRAEARGFLSDPSRRAYGLSVESYREKVSGWLAEAAHLHLGEGAYPGVTTDEHDLAAFVTTFETLAFGDLSLLIRFGVQFGLFGGSIYSLGTEAQRREHLPAVASLALPGCFAMSEVGHGSDVASLETVAVWDRATRTFVVHTPREAARKDWIGGAARNARMATVFAQLEADGERHGVHAFLVPIRDEGGALLPGVRAGDSGHKMGLNGVDNGRLWFDRVRVPEGALLARFARMDASGAYESPIANPSRRFFTMLGTLVGGRISIAAGAVSVAKVALSIAIRYATARRQFGATDGREVPLLAYPTHARRLLPRLATTYVLHFAIDALKARFGALQRKAALAHEDAPDSREIEAEAAALKALASWHAVDTARGCREACGGQGYLSVNRLPDLCADVEIFTTFEGDNTVLLQLVAKSLLSGFRRRFEGTGLGGVARHLLDRARTAVAEKNPVAVRRTDDTHLRDRGFHLAALRYREERLLATAAARLRKRLGAKMDPHEAMLEVQEHLVALARAHADRLALAWFDEAVSAMPAGPVRERLDRLGALHAITLLRAEAAFFLTEGYFDGVKERALREEGEELLRALQPDAVGLVDAFGIPPACLAAPIAFMDPAHPHW
ncbi:MAG: acyl-CoA dehydrogenase [Deltaproteobacteria bacterium]|nr:acyl-CoA dehydrogenase [Myxococcales bacterium]MDP3213058.1 acyl-CoA dehydrogenase [Deltaproteobacteria bacterium]